MKARLPQGYGGGPGNIQQMLKQAQQAQEKMEQKQAEIEAREFSAQAGGGAVSVVMSGKKELQSIQISPDVVDPEDVEMLQDLVVAAVNEVIRQVETTTTEEMQKITGGLSMPSMF